MKIKFRRLLSLGIIAFGLLIITLNCEKNDTPTLEETIIEEVNDSTFVLDQEIQFIKSSELPEAFKEAVFITFSEQKMAQSKQQLLEANFEPLASVVISKNGILTYALPIKTPKVLIVC